MGRSQDTGHGALDRVPPQAIEAEQAVLGACLLDEEAVGVCLEVLGGDVGVFYQESHRVIWGTMVGLAGRRAPVDMTTVLDGLIQGELLERAGGAVYVAELTGVVPTSANARFYAGLVREAWQRREVIRVCGVIAERGYSGPITSTSTKEEGEGFLDWAEGEMFRVCGLGRSLRGVVGVKDVLEGVIDRIDRLYQDGITGLGTGLADLDQCLRGLEPGQFVVIAARPSVGKTALALALARHVAGTLGKRVYFASLEMEAAQLVERLLYAIAEVDKDKVAGRFIRKQDLAIKLRRGCDVLEELQGRLMLDESSEVSVMGLRSRVRRARKLGVDLIIVDYLQLMTGSAAAARNNRNEEVGEISRGLKGLAREMGCPLVCLCQLSREAAKDSRGPQLHHLRESGSIEQDADVVLMLDRGENANELVLNVAKQRNGPVKELKFFYDRDTQRIAGFGQAPAWAGRRDGWKGKGGGAGYSVAEPVREEEEDVGFPELEGAVETEEIKF